MSDPAKLEAEVEMVDTVPSVANGDNEKKATLTDDVFGEITEDGPNYRNVGWIGTVALMMKISIGLGVLSIPTCFDILGIVPGTICLLLVGVTTTWCSYEVGVFKLNHPEVYGIDDVGRLLFGQIGRNVFGTAFCLCYTFTSGSGMLGISISINSLSSHGTCTAVFVAVAAVTTIVLSSIRTLGRIQVLAWVGVISIIVSVFIVTVGVGIQDRPASAPQEGPWESDFRISNTPSFAQAASAISTFVFAYAGTPAFFPIVSEMRDPRLYARALLVCQSGITVAYVTIGCVVYYYCGSYVASPTLGSAGALLKKVCYGIALPGLLIGATLSLHLSAKYIFVRALRGSVHLTSNSVTHWAVWLSCTAGLGLVAYIIASAVPKFDNLVSLVGALFITLCTFQSTGSMWLYDNWAEGKRSPTRSWRFMVCWCVFIVTIGVFLTISGTYGSIVNIIDAYKESGGSAAWSCADNSNSS